MVLPAVILKRLEVIEERNSVKRELPWDCKNLMRRYEEERARRGIIFGFAEVCGDTCNPPDPYRLSVENTRGLSREAREFLSLSAEMQGKAVEYHFPPKNYTLEEEDELRRKIIEKINRI